MKHMLTGSSTPRGFTLVEILIVVLILGILAGIALPQFGQTTRAARTSVLAQQLHRLRAQVALYRVQHQGTNPGWLNGNPTPSTDRFVDQLTMPTNIDGQTAASSGPSHPMGPYLERMPTNPINDLDTVRFYSGADFPGAPTGAAGWIVDPASGRVVADVAGNDDNGKAWISY